MAEKDVDLLSVHGLNDRYYGQTIISI
jgi:hypothetical protein